MFRRLRQWLKERKLINLDEEIEFQVRMKDLAEVQLDHARTHGSQSVIDDRAEAFNTIALRLRALEARHKTHSSTH